MSYDPEEANLPGQLVPFGRQPWSALPKWARILTCGCLIAIGLFMLVFLLSFVGILGLLMGPQ